MATNNKRREATRRQLEAQLRERQVREARRRRLTLIGSVVGSVAVVAAIVIIVVVASSSSGGGGKKNQAATSKSPSPSTSASSSAAALAPVAACTKPSGKSKVSFNGITVSNFSDTSKQPTITSKGTSTPPSLECADLVVGKGKPASAASNVQVHYTGVLYKNGTVFDSSYKHSGSKPTALSLAGVVPGFTQGIGGDGKVAPMRVGGIRVLLIPASLGYGAQASGPIPANSTLVFVVHLAKVS